MRGDSDGRDQEGEGRSTSKEVTSNDRAVVLTSVDFWNAFSEVADL